MKRFFSCLVMLAILLSLVAPALPARAEQAADEPVEARPDLRVGILSDIHVSTDYFGGVQPERWRNVLQIYKTMDLDAIVVAGDLQENAGTSEADIAKQKQWIDIVVDTWYEVFPEKPGEEGYVEPIFIYGNHDATLVTEQYWPEEWGAYQDSYVKQVNGYQFVGVHNAKEHTAGTLVSSAVDRTPDKPVFYIQHCPIFNTVPSSGDTGYGTLGGVIPGDGWQRVVIDSGVIQAKLKQDRDLTKITLISFQFAFENDKGYPRKITIDNMHLVDDVEGTAETDAATDLLANATYTVETNDSENFGYIHNAEGFGHGDESLYAHKFYATPTAEGDISVLYTLDKSYDLTNKNLEMDVMFFHAPGYFYVQLFDSNMVQVTSGSGSIQGSTYADINIDLLSALQSGADLRDVKYIRINTRFANNGYNNKAVYVDNVRIFDIDVYGTPLKGSNMLFIGDSITVASPFKGWDGELKEHYGIHNYNVGVGGASYMSKSGRSLIANQEGYDILTNYIAPFMGTLTGDTVPAYRDLEN